MPKTCVKCGTPLPPSKTTGRPQLYCNVACKRTAELEITRLNRRLAKFEDELPSARRQAEHGYQMGAQFDQYRRTPQQALTDLENDIEEANERLLQLLDEPKG